MSRSRCDQLFALLRERGYFQHTTYLHYSNLSLRERQEVERQLQRHSQALCIATSTLELGIDIGDVDTVVLYEPPESVTTFLQRLGRANRQAQTVSFRGICRGARAGEQLVQFLALCHLAQQGKIEQAEQIGQAGQIKKTQTDIVPQLSQLPSVLVQQVLSCLYERKQIRRASLQALFPAQAQLLDTLLPALETRRWLRSLREVGRPETWRGGWHYARALRANHIWSNFPDTDEPYTLEVDEQTVADLPTALVRQMDLGDRLNLAGRRIRILDIQDGGNGARKVVRATPTEATDLKELSWLGTGAPVSWEVAQAVRPLLQAEHTLDSVLSDGLFTRTRMLLQDQRQAAERQVVLHNGLALSRTSHGLYRYASYLGSIGNFIFARTVERYYSPLLEDFVCSWDAFGIECSDCIDVQRLPLPVGRGAFQRWAAQHLPAVQALLALNAFCRALPRELLIEEVTYFLWDERVSEAFVTYRQCSSEIAHGDPRHLEWEQLSALPDTESAAVFIRQGPQPTLLEHEAIRLGLSVNSQPAIPKLPVQNASPRALTGTMLGSYIQHQQCARLLSFELLPFDAQPPKRSLVDSTVGAVRAERGQEFEAWVVSYLEQNGAVLVRVAEEDGNGGRLSLSARQADTLACLARLIQTAQDDVSDHGQQLGYLVQPVLMLPGLISQKEWDGTPVDGVGIPDLIEATLVHNTVWLRVADIKDSAAPRYSQKWQVAFYAVLLEKWLQQHTFAVPVRLADSGVVLTRPIEPDSGPSRHVFALRPYLDAFPFVQQQIRNLLTRPVAQASWQLQAHCATCGYVESCYRQALSSSDVMLLPHLSPGALLKLQTAGLQTLPQLLEWAEQTDHAGQTDMEEPETALSPQQTLHMSAQVRGLVHNQIILLNKTTTLYPANISTVIFLSLLRDPRTGRPRGWGLQWLGDNAPPAATRSWIAISQADITSYQQACVEQLQDWWQEASGRGRGPHLVTFDSGSIDLLREEMLHATDPHALDFLWHAERPRHTALRQLMLRHFTLPIPVVFSLETLAYVWGRYPDGVSALLQEDAAGERELLGQDSQSELNAEQVERLQDRVHTSLQLLQDVWQACTAHLRSDWQQTDWTLSRPSDEQGLEQASITFLEQQRNWRIRDIEAVQQLPLAERIERYRALGPLEFEDARLDTEGRFVYHFRLPAQTQVARFRAGDFLKLNPIGSANLQAGFSVIITDYEPHTERISLTARQGRLAMSKRLHYSLDEDIEDWTTARVMHAVHEVFVPGQHPELTALVTGRLVAQHDVADTAGFAWAQNWVQQLELNARQREALLVPFRSRVGLIEGPPGTGKTHLLAWMLIALVAEAAQAKRPLRIAVSALTHQAIDNVLLKVQQLLHSNSPAIGKHFPAQCLKWGRRQEPGQKEDADGEAADALGLHYVDRAEEVLPLPYLILGATGFGLYQLFDSRSGKFPAFFDWIIVDEASQMLLPQALLSLVYGKGKYVLCGDLQQLPPVILGRQESDAVEYPRRSILDHLLTMQGPGVRVRLNETYRLNRELCALPSRLWYQNDLQPAAENAGARLSIPAVQQIDIVDEILDPERPVTLVLADHTTDHQQSAQEVEIIARLALRLLLDYGLTPDRLAIVSPHRAQNNAITQRLASLIAERQPDTESVMSLLPVIDTVERLQGAEREVILFSVTTSDPDQRENPFLNNPNRFNVAVTRARHKLVVVGSSAFFGHVAQTEDGLQANQCFKAYYQQCQEAGAVFELGKGDV